MEHGRVPSYYYNEPCLPIPQYAINITSSSELMKLAQSTVGTWYQIDPAKSGPKHHNMPNSSHPEKSNSANF